MAKAEQSTPLPTKEEYIEFPSVVVARLVKGPANSYLNKIESIFDVKVVHNQTMESQKPSQRDPKQNSTQRYKIKGVVSDVDLVKSLLKDVAHEATLLAEKENLRDKNAVNIAHFQSIEQHLSVAIPGYASRRGEEKRMQRVATAAASVAAEQVRRAFTTVNPNSPPAQSSRSAAVSPDLSVVNNQKPETEKPALAAPPKISPSAKRLLAGMPEFMPRNTSQAILKTSLEDTAVTGGDASITIAFALGAAGGGKSFVPLYHGFEQVRRGMAEYVALFRPRATMGGSDLGAVGGDAQKKMYPYLAAQEENILKITGKTGAELVTSKLLILDTGDTSRGRTINNAVLIIDEAQNFGYPSLKGLSTRIGEKTQMVIGGDISAHQNDLRHEQSGLPPLAAHIISDALENPDAAKILSVVRYSNEDSKARSATLPIILRALSTAPAGFVQVETGSRLKPDQIRDIERNRQLADRLSQEFSVITENRFAAQAAIRWPEIAGHLSIRQAPPLDGRRYEGPESQIA